MASSLFSETLLGHRLIRFSSSLPNKPLIFSPLFNKRQLRVQVEPSYRTYKASARPARFMASSAIETRIDFSTQSLSTNDPVISVDWLHANLRELDLKVLDSSWYMPDEQRNPIQEYKVAHIPGALFFDVDGITDRTTKLPHMLPSEEAFAAAVSALSIQNNDGVVVYDGKGIFSAARVWWLDQSHFKHNFSHILSGHSIRIEEKTHQHIDARSKPRFDGAAPEPRKGIRSVMYLAASVFLFPRLLIHQFGISLQMLDASQTLLPADELKKRFDEMGEYYLSSFFIIVPFPIAFYSFQIHQQYIECAYILFFDESSSFAIASNLCYLITYSSPGISLQRSVVTSCGTGVTACVLALGLHRLGKPDVSVYDGSWTECGAQSDTLVNTSL
ncbi:hypothetical protein CRYUN_Cryun39dG0071400 [Craigia yunnanensis]